MSSPKVDRHLLHQYLWRRCDRRSVVRIKHTELAEELGVTRFTMSVIFRELENSGRVKRLSFAGDGVDYLVRDPERSE